MSVRRAASRLSRQTLDDVDATPSNLPPPETRRWVARRKAQVVAAVRAGHLTQDVACERYGISAEEFASWERAIDQHGLGALRVTRLQEFRHA